MSQGGLQSFIMNYYRNIDRSKVQFDFIVHTSENSFYYNEIKALGGQIHIVPPMTIRSISGFSKAFYKILLRHPGYLIVHSHLNWLNIVPLRIAKKYGLPIRISHSHGSYSARSLYKKIQRFIFQMTIGVYSTDFLACSTVAGVWLYGNKFLTDKRAKIVHNAIDLDKFQFNANKRLLLRNKHGIALDTHVLISVSRLVPGKNLKFLLDIFREYNKIYDNTILIIVGDGIIRDELERKAERLGLIQKIIFLGMVDNVQEYLSAADFFVFPTFPEGLSISLIEAQVSGLPAIVSTEGISKEAFITNSVVFYSLKKLASEWARQIFSLEIKERNIVLQDIRDSGYDIKEEAKKLQKFYLARVEDVKTINK